MRSLDELLDEAKCGQLTDEELAYVVDRIENSQNEEDQDLYILLYTLGKSGAIEHRDLVERFLYYPSFPMISAMALRTLANYWDFLEEYLPEIKVFLRSVEWDNYDHVRISALTAAGRYLTGAKDTELLSMLIEIFTNTEECDVIREGAFEALADAVGRDPREIIGAKEMDLTVLDEAIHMLQQND